MSELTDRMRTCAAYIIANRDAAGVPTADVLRATADAADLLVEASNQLQAHLPVEPQAQLIEILEPIAAQPPVSPAQAGDATWLGPHDTLPGPRSPKACPQCDSRTHKKVFRQGRRLMLACPVCAKEWPYG